MSSIIKKPLFWVIVLVASGLVFFLIFNIVNREEATSNSPVSSQGEGDKDEQDPEEPTDQEDQEDEPSDDDKEDQTDDEEGENGEEGEPPATPPPSNPSLVDDWVYEPGRQPSSRFASPASFGVSPTSVASTNQSVGFSAGGSKDIDTFRRNIELGYLPPPTTLSHEGLFYDYFFETGPKQACSQLFCPNYATATTKDPFSEETEYFLAVGLDSNIKASDFKRKKLNLVIVLDISGSMSSSFDSYYYDQTPGASASNSSSSHQPTLSKMEVANRSLVALLKHLKADDRLGVVLFNDSAHLAKDLRLIKETDLGAIKSHILEIQADGGTNMEAGYRQATQLLEQYKDASSGDYENRIIFLTDAMPNLGSTTKESLTNLARQNAADKIYSSFIGIGLDFNTELIQALSQIRGANYFSVHSSQEFARRLDEGFDYMVTPLVFDLNLKLEAAGYEIQAVYGSPEANLATGQIMKVNTLFPSLRVDNQTRGGLILLHLKKKSSQADLNLSVSYLDRAGRKQQNQQTIKFADTGQDTFAHNGVRKGIVLARMINLLKDWLRYEYKDVPRPTNYQAHGIPIIIDWPSPDSRWERGSQSLVLSSNYRSVIKDFKAYLSKEHSILKDDTLKQEIQLLDKILEAAPPAD